MIKSKHGKVKMNGGKDRIFTDMIRAMETYLIAFSKITAEDETDVLTVLIYTLLEESTAELDLKKLRKNLKILEVAKHDD